VGTPLTIDIRGDIVDPPSSEHHNGRAYCKITISDNGIGFEQEHAEQIFGMFKSLHPKGRYEGTGIGLAITKKIIEKHHGRITAEAIPNKGAAFAVLLPLKQKS
jgi:signal transduction histidine kinase